MGKLPFYQSQGSEVELFERAWKNNMPLLIVGDVEPKVAAALAMNKNKGSIKVNIVPAPTHPLNDFPLPSPG